ncbi:murein biosynthesis integral membrane protein MurJ [Microaerobacter geothermalis]|uniref:murein biosynthesis integral membrane protein MurJ n=1 Tax=Microaerobacter geothermalis TaxID=674972 RepID=UPI001F1623E5|nr:murein biosynthesis integral membrane protein MurJ [Microaerobacter geothermalis]MCF6092586.1 murein biosynthesis integral membrane protein MurJ [Microaerobacter geothermalis]
MAHTLLKSAMMIVAVTMIGRLLGFVRNIFITKEFGASVETDAYFIALAIPMTFFLVVPGAISAVFIPRMKGFMGKGQRSEQQSLFRAMWTMVFVIFLLIALLFYWQGERVISLLAPGFSDQALELAIQLFNWMVPSLWFIGIIGLFSSVLNAHHHFFIPTFGTVVNSLIVIASIIWLTPYLGIEGLALGTMLGFAGYALLLVAPVLKRSYSLSVDPHFYRHPEIKGMGERFVPILIGAGITQLTVFIDRFLASQMEAGRISALNYGFTVMQLPMAVFVGAFTVPLFPLLSEYVKQGEWRRLQTTVEKGIGLLWLVLIPTTGGLLVLGNELIQLLFQRGEFSAEDTVLTNGALLFYSIGMFGLAGRDLLTRVYYALEDTKTPVMIGIINIFLYIGGSLLFIPYFEHGGIALGASLAAIFSMIFLWVILIKRQKWKIHKSLGFLFIRGGVAAAGMGGVLVYLKSIWYPSVLILVPSYIVIGAVLYVLFLWILKEPMLFEMLGRIFRRK